jgi:hypothetical protein
LGAVIFTIYFILKAALLGFEDERGAVVTFDYNYKEIIYILQIVPLCAIFSTFWYHRCILSRRDNQQLMLTRGEHSSETIVNIKERAKT